MFKIVTSLDRRIISAVPPRGFSINDDTFLSSIYTVTRSCETYADHLRAAVDSFFK